MDLSDIDKIPRSIDEWRLHNLEMKTDIYVNDEDIKVEYSWIAQLFFFYFSSPFVSL